MTTPLFSVLIPTKDRPEFVRDAIASVLLQEGPERDFELIVSNNGGGEETKRAVATWLHDDRVSYVEPPSELSMPDHWEWASQFLRGEYVMILTDRLLLRQGALASLRKVVASKPLPQVISWPVATYSEVSGATANMGDESAQIEEHSARAIWEGLREGRNLPSPILPRGLNSCVRTCIYDRVRAVRGRAFDSITPDFSSAFSVILVSDVIHHCSRPLAIEQGVRISNGGLMRKGGDTGYMQPLGTRAEMHHVPLCDIGSPLVAAVIYEDLLRTAAVFGSPMSWNEVNPGAFYRNCFREIAVRHAAALPWSGALRRARRQFAAAIEREGVDRSRNIKRELHGSFPWREFVGVAAETLGNPQLLRFLRKMRTRLKPAARAASALEAAGFGNAVHPPMDQTRMRRLPRKEAELLGQRK